MRKNEMMEVVEQKQLTHNVYELTLKGERVREMNEPGQFVHLRISDDYLPTLRRPISIASINPEEYQFTMIYRAEGMGTKRLAEKTPGEFVDVLGPLGNGFSVDELKEGETALLVGGGIGVPPLYELSKRLKEKGINVVHVLGFQSVKDVFYEEKFKTLGETFIATVDGTYGTKGFVTTVIDQFSLEYDALFSCGPTPMLKALQDTYTEKPLFISLEERMGCGIGACFACVCRVDEVSNAYKKVCTDGPVFAAGEVLL
ncbi:dihydroorotate dehydrogenase electron transfer subunit [Metabacillus iocasae]|uniref:Dihydroorotate dehydrogenase B (NAD(+)), electron transfer subunit n=1 Tax=Priestia iocasae TaxID=2291674 RepID=A0ABS2QQR6_9BACI|nr:dihydroorotate dehydrogenase electron transfer subunit [Metabacillus iocasae]MBM7701801.1 dihydroorotate dehydrogenase electron transfer subunit [Metabacillus iocasae]